MCEISTQLACLVHTQAYCITTISAGEVGQHIYLEIICLQGIKVHNAYPVVFVGVRRLGITTVGPTSQYIDKIMRLWGIS